MARLRCRVRGRRCRYLKRRKYRSGSLDQLDLDAGLDDSALTEPFDAEARFAPTRLGHYTYALRHTMHHHGSLVTVAIHNGAKPG